MLREDGRFKVFVIQVQEEGHTSEDDEWRLVNIRDAGGYGPVTGFGSLMQCDLPRGTGGTTDADEAYAGLAEISRRWPCARFRLALIKLSQKTVVMAHAKDGAISA